ncbi:MAG: peptidoglycan D,D-transpeptidase FtsI family protein [Gemmatimonas sp.]
MSSEELARLDGVHKQAIETGRKRLLIGSGLFVMVFVAIVGRLADLTLMQEGYEPRLASSHTQPFAAGRADIIDRNGVILATSLSTASLYANPHHVLDAKDAARKIVKVLPELDAAQIEARLSSGRSFVWIKRNLTPKTEYALNALGIPGLYFVREERRVYPQGSDAAHVVGYAGTDNHGLAGIEKSFDEQLRSSAQPVQLSLDLRVQHILHEELAAAVKKFSAEGASGLVMDVSTGEIIAMVSLPDFDPHNPMAQDPKAIFNRDTLGVYEMGSTFKLFTVSMALDSGSATLASSYDAAHPIKVGRFTITDYKGENRWLTLPEVIRYSSNLGAARIALEAGVATHRQYIERFGLTKPLSLEIGELGTPRVPNPWREVSTMTIAFGHGLSVTPVHLASGISAVANGGVLHPATLIKRDPSEPVPGERVISEQTSYTVRKLMRLVVTDGTGKLANVPGYLVGGKTGTAEKNGVGGYKRKANLSLFVGAFPMTAPRYIVVAMVDEPHGTKDTYGYSTGGWTAAPVAGRVIARSAAILGVHPVDENAPDVRSAMDLNVAAPRSKRIAAN